MVKTQSWTEVVTGKLPLRSGCLSLLFGVIVFASGICGFHTDYGVYRSPVLKSTVDVRDGPGSYYPMSGRLNRTAVIEIREETDGWVRIQSGELQGWIPSLAVETTSDGQADDPFDSLRERFERAFEEESAVTEPYVSEAQVVAAVKGFIAGHIKASGEDLEDFSDHFIYYYDPVAYQRFRDSRVSSGEWRRLKRTHRLSTSDVPVPHPENDMIGWSAGNRIAQAGIYDDPQLRQYLNHIAMLVTESSQRPDIPVNIIILDTEDVVGYAVPGGLVFVSLGALRIMQTEAEFATFVGHEITHLVYQHGETELAKRETRILADDATRRMDRYIRDAGMADDRYREITEELQQIADDLFEYLVSDRLHEYEEEADYYGLLYASRAGYRGEALYNVLERIARLHYEPEHEMKSAWFGDTMELRLESMRRNLSNYPMRQGNHHTETWASQTGHLRN